MSAQGEFADDGAAFQNFFVELLVFFGVADVDACAEDADGAAIGGHGALMAEGVNTAGHAADNDQPTRGQIAAQLGRHLRAVESGFSCTDDAERWKVEDLRVPAHIEQDGWIVNLKKRLRIFGGSPVD